MENKQIKNPYIHFIGENSRDVTQSMSLIKYLNYNIMIDCGMYQSTDPEHDYKINSNLHKAVKPKNLDAILITHASHLDHIGRLPLLYRRGCNCPVYIPKGIKGIFQLLLQDSVHIFEQEFERTKRQPIYTQDDVNKLMQHVVECEFHKKNKVNNNISFVLYNAQHIPKASQIYIELTDGINLKKLGFTGDISCKETTNFLPDFESLPQVDVLVSETTYNDKKRLNKNKDIIKDKEKLDLAIREAKKNKGKVIIPTFANDRAQNMLFTLYEMYGDDIPLNILMDSPLSYNISLIWEKVIDKNHELWDKAFHWDKVHWVKSYKERVSWSKIDEPMIIICSGGFLQNGTGVFWTKECLGNKKNYMVFTGYSSPESIAGKIKSGVITQIKIDGKAVQSKAHILVLNSFGSHMDYKELMDYYLKVQYTKICLVHGEQSGKIKFAEDLRDKLSKANRTSKVIATNYETKVHF